MKYAIGTFLVSAAKTSFTVINYNTDRYGNHSYYVKNRRGGHMTLADWYIEKYYNKAYVGSQIWKRLANET